MKKWIGRLLISSTAFALLSFCGCTYAPMANGSQVITPEGIRIYQGQSTDSVEECLGAPDLVSSGYCKNSWAGYPWVSPGSRTVEWVYLTNPISSILIWFDNGRVASVAYIPTDEVRR